MASFNDLHFEIQMAIWELVLHSHGGVHWVQIEDSPLSVDDFMESFARIRDVFGSKEPETRADFCWEQSINYEYRDYCNNKCADEDPSNPFSQYLYTIVPSVWGSSKSLTPSSDED